MIPEFCIAHSYIAQFLRYQHACVQNIRDFPQTKLDIEIKAPFPLNEHGDPNSFSFINSMRTISAITEKKKLAEIYGYFLTNEINATDRDVMGPPEQVRIMLPYNAEYLKPFFLGHR